MEKKTSIIDWREQGKNVKTEIFLRKIGRKIIMASKVREDSDYDEDYMPSSENTINQIEPARELINLVDVYIQKYK